MLPRALHPAYARSLLARGALVWLVCRALVAAGGRSLALAPLPALVLVGIVAWLVYLEVRRHLEAVTWRFPGADPGAEDVRGLGRRPLGGPAGMP